MARHALESHEGPGARGEREQLRQTAVYPWGGVRLPDTDGALAAHFALLGAPGSGKTLSINMLMKSVLAHPTHGLRHRALVYDPKRELYPLLVGMGVPQQLIAVLHPFDTRSTAWDLAQDVTSDATIRQLASVIAPVPESSRDDFFPRAANELLIAVLKVLRQNAPDAWTLRDIVEATATPNVLKHVLSQTRSGRETLEAYLSSNAGRTSMNVYTQLRSKVGPWETIAALADRAANRVSLSGWMKGSGVLLLGADAERSATLDPLNRLLFRRASDLVTARVEEYPLDETWFFMDEAREAGKLEGLRELLTTSRSKSGRVVLGFQDIEGLRASYGVHEGNEVLGLCQNFSVLRLTSPESAQWASRLFGSIEDWRESKGESKGPDGKRTTTCNAAIQKLDVVLPQELQALPAPTRAHGFHGYHLAPGMGIWRKHVAPSFIARSLPCPSTSVRAYEPRPASDEERIPWQPEDLTRLSLPPLPEGEAKPIPVEREPAGVKGSFRTMDPATAGQSE